MSVKLVVTVFFTLFGRASLGGGGGVVVCVHHGLMKSNLSICKYFNTG